MHRNYLLFILCSFPFGNKFELFQKPETHGTDKDEGQAKNKKRKLGTKKILSQQPPGKTPRNGSPTPGQSGEGRQDETLPDLPGPDVIDKR